MGIILQRFVPCSHHKYAPSPEPRVGDILEIAYDGVILESYPAQFGTIYSMRVVSQDGRLTLDDVVMLSQKGDALSWSDFEQYQGREVGSGLYIMRYEIDELFDVWWAAFQTKRLGISI